MRKMIVIAVVLTMALAGTSLMAQATTSTATVGAVVNAVLTVTNNSDIDFGSIQATGSPVLDPQGTNTAAVGSSSTFGKFTLGGSDATVVITYDATAALDNNATGTMTFTADVSGKATDDIATSVDIASGGTATLSGGAYYIYVGGNLGSLTTQETGTYSADTPWGISVEYQ